MIPLMVVSLKQERLEFLSEDEDESEDDMSELGFVFS